MDDPSPTPGTSTPIVDHVAARAQQRQRVATLRARCLVWRSMHCPPRAPLPHLPPPPPEEWPVFPHVEAAQTFAACPGSGTFLAVARALRGHSAMPAGVTVAAHPVEALPPAQTEVLSGSSRTTRRVGKRRRVEAAAAAWAPTAATSSRRIGAPDRVMVVAQLPPATTRADLVAFGARFGRVEDAVLAMRPLRQRRRAANNGSIAQEAVVQRHLGYGFIAFARPQELTAAMSSFEAVARGAAPRGEASAFFIRHQRVVCDYERGRRGLPVPETRRFLYPEGRYEGEGAGGNSEQGGDDEDRHIADIVGIGRAKIFADFCPPDPLAAGNADLLRCVGRRQDELQMARNIAAAAAGTVPPPPFVPLRFSRVARFCAPRREWAARCEALLEPRTAAAANNTNPSNGPNPDPAAATQPASKLRDHADLDGDLDDILALIGDVV